MCGRQSLNLELTPLDPDLERNIRRVRRAHVEMEDISRNENREEQDDFQDARTGHMSKEELMMWISLHHYGNFLHLLRLVPIRA